MSLGLLLAEFLSNAGTGAGFSVLGLALAREGEAWALAALASLGYLVQPLGLFTGLIIDRANPRTLIALGKLAEGGVWLGLMLLSPASWMGLFLAFFAVLGHDLAYDALSAGLTRRFREDLLAQTGRFQNAWLLGNLVGTLVGPALYLSAGKAVLSLASVLLLTGALAFARWRALDDAGPERAPRAFLPGELFEGFRWVVEGRTLRTLVVYTLLVVFAFSLGRALDPMIGLALGVPPELLGFYLGAATIGSVAGNLAGPGIGTARSVWLGFGLALMGTLMLILTRHPWAMLAALVRVGGFTLGLLGLRVLRQWHLPDALVGRATAAMNLASGIAGVLGAALAGALGGQDPLRTLYASSGLLAVVLVGLAFHFPAPRLRELEARLREGGSLR